MQQQSEPLDPKAAAAKQKAESADVQQRFDECYKPCVEAHPKPTDAAKAEAEKRQLVQFLIDERCATEDERDSLLAQAFEYVRSAHCRCICDAATEVRLSSKKGGDSKDGNAGLPGSLDLDHKPKVQFPSS